MHSLEDHGTEDTYTYRNGNSYQSRHLQDTHHNDHRNGQKYQRIQIKSFCQGMLQICSYRSIKIRSINIQPRIVYKIREIIKVGAVVEIIAVTWSNNPVWATAAARFVVSDRGENLSPT